MRKGYLLYLLVVSIVTIRCSRQQQENGSSYTHEDFLTESYLVYHDSIVHAWNMMISDDNEKLTSLHLLITELQTLDESKDQAVLKKFDSRLRQLRHIRYTQKSMANADVIEEYDFASTALVREVLSTAEMSEGFAENVRLQSLVEHIRLAEERIENYRADYDDLINHYNKFLEENRADLVQLSRDSIKKKAQFQLVSIE